MMYMIIYIILYVLTIYVADMFNLYMPNYLNNIHFTCLWFPYSFLVFLI